MSVSRVETGTVRLYEDGYNFPAMDFSFVTAGFDTDFRIRYEWSETETDRCRPHGFCGNPDLTNMNTKMKSPTVGEELDLFEMLGLFVREDALRQPRQRRQKETLELFYGSFDTSQYDEVLALSREYVSQSMRSPKLFQEDVAELAAVIDDLYLKNDPTNVEEEHQRFGIIIDRIRRRYGRRFSLRPIQTFRSPQTPSGDPIARPNISDKKK